MQHLLLREAAEWRLLSLLFECPTGDWQNQVAILAALVADTGLLEAAQSAAAEATEGLYHSIFGPGGPAAPREVSYVESVQLGYLISELEGYYHAFSFQNATLECVDHVSVESGFVGYLKLKEAYALASGDVEHTAVTAEAARRIVEDHLSNLAEPLAGALANSGVRYLELAGKALLYRVGPRRGVPTQAFPIHPSSQASGEESLFECGDS